MPGLDAWVLSSPHHDDPAGGDVHYVSLCGGGITTRVAIADVSGHGASVAEFSCGLRDLIRRHINRKDQSRLVAELSRTFGELAQLERFATAIVATYLVTRRRLVLCIAGHPRPLLYRAASAEWSLLDAPDAVNLPLGIDDAARLLEVTLDLAPGDLLVLYTDALVEAADPAGRQLGEAGLLQAARLLTDHAADPRAVGSALVEAVAAHRAGQPPDDDLTLIALRHTGTGPRRPGLRERAEVYARVFGLRPT
jgi:serine phosphatase RsbU (regulator of sigma subunit)